jgi:hypothetical protein
MGFRITGKMLFWGVTVRVFWKRLAFESVDCGKKIALSKVGRQYLFRRE